MILTFNDSTNLAVQSVDEQADGSLLIKVIQITEDELKTVFGDTFKTKRMVVVDQETTVGTYENYTNLDAVVKYTAGIMGVILFKVGETPEEKLNALIKENETLKEKVANLENENKTLKESNETLLGCVLEMSEVVYQ